VITTCKGDEHGAPGSIAESPRFRVGASYGTFGSRLSFVDGPALGVERRGVTASFEYRWNAETTFGGGAGAGLGGAFTLGKERYRISPGWMVLGTWSRRLLDGVGNKPFLLIGLAFGASGASTREEVTTGKAPETSSLYALDVRIALTVGKTFFRTISPYASVRAFGGPVFWKYRGDGVVGGDTRHYQIAVGMAVALPRGFDVFVDGSPLGEQAISLGAGKSF
jgi:hypothetical protein